MGLIQKDVSIGIQKSRLFKQQGCFGYIWDLRGQTRPKSKGSRANTYPYLYDY